MGEDVAYQAPYLLSGIMQRVSPEVINALIRQDAFLACSLQGRAMCEVRHAAHLLVKAVADRDSEGFDLSTAFFFHGKPCA